jgi:hypothetical protein
MQDVRGYNPYKFGMAGGSDSHNTAQPVPAGQLLRPARRCRRHVERRFAGVLIGGTMDVRLENPGGLTGVWAEENTRASLWDAMHRKETFGVSGPRIKVRLFGGWGYDKDIVKAATGSSSLTRAACRWAPTCRRCGRQGHGAELRRLGVKDPTSGNLDRIQIVKGWTQNGQSFEKVFDVVWSGDRKPTSGRAGCRPSATRWTSKRRPTRTTSARRTEDGVDRSGVRRQPARLLLRARAGDTDAALDADPGRQGRVAAARCRAARPGRNAPGPRRSGTAPSAEARKKAPAGMTVATEEEGRQGAQRRAVEGAGRRQGLLAAQQRDGRAVLPDASRTRVRRTCSASERMRPCRAPSATSSATATRERPPRTGSKAASSSSPCRRSLTHSPSTRMATPLRRAQQRVRLCQLRDHSRTADRGEPADGGVQPVLDRARPDGRAEEADRPDAAAGDQATRCPEEGRQAQRPAEGGGVAQDRRFLRRDDLAAAQCGAAGRSSRPCASRPCAKRCGGG